MSWQERLAVLRDMNRWELALLHALILFENAQVRTVAQSSDLPPMISEGMTAVDVSGKRL
jgi:hypothetical protein